VSLRHRRSARRSAGSRARRPRPTSARDDSIPRMQSTSFVNDPLHFVTGPNRDTAIDDLRTYFAGYTGSWVEHLAATDQPDTFTAQDFVAVSMLGVTIPAPTAVWLLNEGAARATELLRQLPPTTMFWDDGVDITDQGPMWRLWDLLRDNGWP